MHPELSVILLAGPSGLSRFRPSGPAAAAKTFLAVRVDLGLLRRGLRTQHRSAVSGLEFLGLREPPPIHRRGPSGVARGILAGWGMATAGWKNTSGQRGGFVSSGPYRFTRNPQYVGDIVFFVGVGVIANSVFLWIAHVLLILGFVVAPLTEEPWLEEQYGDAYREYRRRVPRFL